ncbi:hypothetical protein SETIT_4G234700v2 [Setaria italica]|uniref:Uncharacterized protein n=1 Tax=Setaria italica TaxID=4555 RepID=A0A368QXD8_SETIT|nr:hypothetical protein SETIT_4G234700v2 [Setaria italica]
MPLHPRARRALRRHTSRPPLAVLRASRAREIGRGAEAGTDRRVQHTATTAAATSASGRIHRWIFASSPLLAPRTVLQHRLRRLPSPDSGATPSRVRRPLTGESSHPGLPSPYPLPVKPPSSAGGIATTTPHCPTSDLRRRASLRPLQPCSKVGSHWSSPTTPRSKTLT